MDKLHSISDLLKNDSDSNTGGFWNAPVTKINKETKELLEDEFHLPINWPQRKTCQAVTIKSASSPNSFTTNGGLRSRQAIISTGCYERARYQTDNYLQKDSRIEKERLQNLLIYGQEIAPENTNGEEVRLNHSVKSPEDTIPQLESEIEERQKFLEDMKKLGKDKKYKPIILTEISQRKRQIAVLSATT